MLVVILVVEHICRDTERLPHQVFSRRELVGGLHLSKGAVRRDESANQNERRRDRSHDGGFKEDGLRGAGATTDAGHLLLPRPNLLQRQEHALKLAQIERACAQ